jgi:hypothetical protein
MILKYSSENYAFVVILRKIAGTNQYKLVSCIAEDKGINQEGYIFLLSEIANI